jgi:hypothetical protein
MKTSKIPTFVTIALALAPSLIQSLSAQTLVFDTFEAAVRNGGPVNNSGPASPLVSGVDVDGVGPLTNDYTVAAANSSMATGTGFDNAVRISTGIGGTNSFNQRNVAGFYSVQRVFALQSLAIGDVLSLSFQIQTSGAAPVSSTDGFRFGFFNSGGTSLAANSGVDGGGVFANDTGYVARYSINGSSVVNTGQLVERSSGTVTQNLFQGSFTNVGTAGSGTSAIAIDTAYTATLTLTRTASGVDVSSTFNGVTLSGTDSTTPYTSFDTVGIFFGSQWGSSVTTRNNFIDNVNVTVVPEPATAALVGCGLMAILFYCRRRTA